METNFKRINWFNLKNTSIFISLLIISCGNQKHVSENDLIKNQAYSFLKVLIENDTNKVKSKMPFYDSKSMNWNLSHDVNFSSKLLKEYGIPERNSLFIDSIMIISDEFKTVICPLYKANNPESELKSVSIDVSLFKLNSSWNITAFFNNYKNVSKALKEKLEKLTTQPLDSLK